MLVTAIRIGYRLITEAGEFYLIRTSGTHTVDRITAFIIYHGRVLGSGWGVCGNHDGSDNRLISRIGDTAVKT